MADLSLEAAKKLRAYEAEHPWQAIAGGFTPGIGELSSAAALRDPDAPWWEKALNVPGLLPSLGGASKLAVGGVKGGKALVLLASKLAKTNPEAFAKAAKFVDPMTGKKMAEIDDSLATVDHELLDQMGMHQMQTSLEDAIQHPELFKSEPYLSDVGLHTGTGSPKHAGEYFSRRGSSPGRIHAKPISDPTKASSIRNFENTLFHETQHATDDASGLLEKTSPGVDESKYWFQPDEVRARVAAARQKFSPAGRLKYSFDDHMRDEVSRLHGIEWHGQKFHEAKDADLARQVGLRNLSLEDLLRK